MTDTHYGPSDDGEHGTAYYTAATVRRLIAEAVEKEREACAKVCLAIEDEPIPTAEAADADVAYGMGRSSGAERCAHAIRARSKEAGNA